MCGASSTQAPPTPQVSAVASASGDATPTPTPTPKPTIAIWTLGQERTVTDDGSTYRVTANSFAATETSESVLDVTFCLDSDASSRGHRVVAAMGRELRRRPDLPVGSSYATSRLPAPLYPQDFPVRVGACVKGYIPFTTPAGEPPTEITYLGSEVPIYWTVTS